MEKLININNYKMPSVGLGLWKIEPETTADLVFEAIKIGYRHLDSAADYGNEKQVGEGISRAIKSGICKRDELWITSKLWNTYHRPEYVEKACKKSLLDLKLMPEDVVMIGDDLVNDIYGAQESKIFGILVKTGKYHPGMLESTHIKPDGIINSIGEIEKYINN